MYMGAPYWCSELPMMWGRALQWAPEAREVLAFCEVLLAFPELTKPLTAPLPPNQATDSNNLFACVSELNNFKFEDQYSHSCEKCSLISKT